MLKLKNTILSFIFPYTPKKVTPKSLEILKKTFELNVVWNSKAGILYKKVYKEQIRFLQRERWKLGIRVSNFFQVQIP